MQIDSSIITGISTLLAVGITLFFTSKREKSKFIQDIKMKEYSDLQSFYVDLIASLEKAIKFTKQGENYKDLLHENALISAKSNLIAPNSINEQLVIISEILYDWSSNYRKSLPTKIEGTGLGIISNIDTKYRIKADEIYPTLNKEIWELIKLIKEELIIQKKTLKR